MPIFNKENLTPHKIEEDKKIHAEFYQIPGKFGQFFKVVLFNSYDGSSKEAYTIINTDISKEDKKNIVECIEKINNFIEKDKNQEFKRGYNQCLKDLKLTGERYQNLYL